MFSNGLQFLKTLPVWSRTIEEYHQHSEYLQKYSLKKHHHLYIAMNRIVLFCTLLCAVSFAHAQNPKFDKWKSPSFFRGVNVTNINIKTQKDFDDLKASGANLAQIGTLGFQNVEAPYAANEASAATTDSLVKFCRTSGLYYTIALRQGAGRRDVSGESSGNSSTIWTNSEEQKIYSSTIKSVVERYKNDSLFVGINTLMEPNPLYESLNYKPELLKIALDGAGINMDNLYKMMIDSVRAADAELPVIIQSVSYSSPEFFKMVSIVNDPYAVYEFHSYRPSEFVKAKANSADYPGSYFSLADFGYIMYNQKYLAEVMYSQVLDVQKKTGAPVFLGEFGMMYEQKGGENLLKDIVEIALKHKWHFAYWEYRNGRDDWNIEKNGVEMWEATKNSFTQKSQNGTVSGIEELPFKTSDFQIISDNSSRDGVRFSVNLLKSNSVKAELFNASGERLEALSGEFAVGIHSISFTTQNLPNGLYFINVSDGFVKDMRKLVITE